MNISKVYRIEEKKGNDDSHNKIVNDKEYEKDFEKEKNDESENYENEKFEENTEHYENEKFEENTEHYENEKFEEEQKISISINNKQDNSINIASFSNNIEIIPPNNNQPPPKQHIKENTNPKFQSIININKSTIPINEEGPSFQNQKLVPNHSFSKSINDNNIKVESFPIENKPNKNFTLTTSTKRNLIKTSTVIPNTQYKNIFSSNISDPFQQATSEIPPDQSKIPSNNNIKRKRKTRSHTTSKRKKSKITNNCYFEKTNNDLIYDNYEQYAFKSLNHKLVPITAKNVGNSLSEQQQQKGYLIAKTFKNYINNKLFNNSQLKLLCKWQKMRLKKLMYFIYINKNEEELPITNIQVRVYSSEQICLFYQNMSIETLLDEGIISNDNITGKQLLKYKKQLKSTIEEMFRY